MQFLQQYASFLLNTATIVIAIIVVLSTIATLASKDKTKKSGIKIKKINSRYKDYKNMLNDKLLSGKALKKQSKHDKKQQKLQSTEERKRIFVLKFRGDIRANQVEQLREEITAILTVATDTDEVVACVESPGGVVHGYGLAASQLQRIRNRQIPLTICVDKVAASGGYMMACVADKIIAAPFAIIGSIGVVIQMPNFNKLLEKNDIEYEQLTAGEYKRTLTLFGKNTDKAREKMHEELEETQTLFKDFIAKHRPQVDLNQVATGEHWFASKAIEFKLVDDLQTSDDYLLNASETADLYEISTPQKKSMLQKLSKSARLAYDDFATEMQSRY